MAVVGGSLLWKYYFHQNLPTEHASQDAPIAQPVLLPSINGTLVQNAVVSRRPLAIVIENHPDSRPQSGLQDADVVYETLAEGGITRFLALFQTPESVIMGPVRSARPYFAELASEYGAVFAHVGGSDEVLAKLAAKKYAGVDDANEYFNGSYFSRSKNRAAPHNVYTTIEKLRYLMTDKKWKQDAVVPAWQFSDNPQNGTEVASDVSMQFSTSSYAARFVYDPATARYKRLLAGVAHIDAETKQQITAKTVIAQVVSVTDIPNDPKLRVDIDLDSGGHAYIFHDGTVVHAQWKKSGNRTKYYGIDGQEIVFPRGDIWVGLVPQQQTSVTWK